MKALRKWLKTFALFLTALILFQSCSVYKTPVTLEQAVLGQKEVKITTASDETVKYKYIVYEDGQFYGVKNNPGEEVKFAINVDEVYEVLAKKGGLPTWAIVVISAGALIAIVIVVTLAGFAFPA
ncbi:MAG: hypothetical protein GY931_10130 [Maribacter sp.]|nr:hypothetical protein [Maribacter sp.]